MIEVDKGLFQRVKLLFMDIKDGFFLSATHTVLVITESEETEGFHSDTVLSPVTTVLRRLHKQGRNFLHPHLNLVQHWRSLSGCELRPSQSSFTRSQRWKKCRFACSTNKTHTQSNTTGEVLLTHRDFCFH